MIDPARLASRVFLALTLLFVVFIMVASWTPGTITLGGERKAFSGISGSSDFLRPQDVRDNATNVLLYIPLGVFLALALAPGRPRMLGLWLVVGPAVSLVMESVQMFIGRQPDAVDLVTNSVGYCIGFGVVVAAVRVYGFDPRVLLGVGGTEAEDARSQTVAAVRFVYAMLYALVALLPFDVSVGLENVYSQLFPDENERVRLILDPTYHLGRWNLDGLKLTAEFLGLVPMAMLTALVGGMRGRLNPFSPILATVLLAFACELAQVFVLSRSTDIAILLLAAVAGVCGWLLARTWFNLDRAGSASAYSDERADWRPVAVALLGYAVVLLVLSTSPFRFETDPVTVARKILHDSNLIPFREHFATRSLASAIDIVKEAGLFLPLGTLLALLIHRARSGTTRGVVVLAAGITCGAFAVITELSQSVSIGRYMDITDILLAGAGGLFGAILLGLLRPSAFNRY